MSYEIPGSGSEKSGSDVGVRVFRPNDVSCNLLLQEAKVGLVLVERLDDVIPIPPGIGSALVPLESMSVGIMGQIQSVLGHALTEPGMTKQAVDKVLICIRGVVGKKDIDRFRGGREAMQIVGKAADQSAPIGL